MSSEITSISVGELGERVGEDGRTYMAGEFGLARVFIVKSDRKGEDVTGTRSLVSELTPSACRLVVYEPVDVERGRRRRSSYGLCVVPRTRRQHDTPQG